MGIAERQQAVAGDAGDHGVGAAHAAMHGRDGAEDRIVVQGDAAGRRPAVRARERSAGLGIELVLMWRRIDAEQGFTQLAPVRSRLPLCAITPMPNGALT